MHSKRDGKVRGNNERQGSEKQTDKAIGFKPFGSPSVSGQIYHIYARL